MPEVSEACTHLKDAVCSECLEQPFAIAARLRESELRALVERALNRMGGPTMTYSPANEIREWRDRWAITSAELIAALTTPERGEG